MKHHALVTVNLAGVDREFCLTGKALSWFEGLGIGHRSLLGTFKTMVDTRNTTKATIVDILQYGLMGAGMDLGSAMQIVGPAVASQPLGDSFAAALVVAEAALFGNEEYKAARAAQAA